MDEKTKESKGITRLMESTMFHRVLIGVGAVTVALLIFQAGMYVGFRKAAFSYRGGENYYRAFGEDRRAPFMGMGGMMREEFPGANGTVGKILSIQLPNIVIEGRDATEKTIIVTDKTVVRSGRTTISTSDLRIDDMIVAIGTPKEDASGITATLIRLLPPPPEYASSTGSIPMMSAGNIER